MFRVFATICLLLLSYFAIGKTWEVCADCQHKTIRSAVEAAADGDVVVIKAGPVFEILSRNPMDDLLMASPAISDNILFFRTQHYLVAVGANQ